MRRDLEQAVARLGLRHIIFDVREVQVLPTACHVFLGIDSMVRGVLPDEVKERLSYLPHCKHPLPGTYGEDDIHRMLRAETEIDLARVGVDSDDHDAHSDSDSDTTSPIPMKRVHSDEDLLILSRNYDRLLLWVSAAGFVSKQEFGSACHALDLAESKQTVDSVVRRLQLLGHIEMSPDRKALSVAPPVLIRTSEPEWQEAYVLCGARDTELLCALRDVAEVSERPQTHANGPATVYVCIHDTDKFEAQQAHLPSLSKLKVAKRVAERLALLVPSLQEWKNRLPVVEGIRPPEHIFERFSFGTWVSEAFTKKSGFYTLTPARTRTRDTTLRKIRLFYDAETDHWLQGEWYGLRFLAEQLDMDRCPVRHKPTTLHLDVPVDWRWPLLYERVLVLASGRLPAHSERWLRYEGISDALLGVLRHKLNLDYEEMTLHA